MHKAPDISFDVASVLNRGCRDYQEDAIATDFPIGEAFGYAVLSDGMGGHAAGDVASKIVVTEVFSELKFQTSDIQGLVENMGEVLRCAAVSANECMAAHAANNPQTAGMGATLVAPVFVQNSLYWISIGDSPLYLMRDGRLRQLNEDHSLGPHIDYMVRSGMMPEEIGRNHPDRNALTSVLIGETIERIDCPERPFQLKDGDILVVASDGLQFLSNATIARILNENQGRKSADIANCLLEELRELADPEQDNVSFSVIRVEMAEDAGKRDSVPDYDQVVSRPPRITTRPIRHDEIAEPNGDAEPVAPEVVTAQQNGSNGAKGGNTPIFLRRRWLATDGGA